MKLINKLITELSNSADVIVKEDNLKNMIFIYQEQMCDFTLFLRDLYKDLDKVSRADEKILGLCKIIDNPNIKEHIKIMALQSLEFFDKHS